MTTGPRHISATSASPVDDEDPAAPPQHSGHCSVCQVSEPFDSSLPVIAQLVAFMAQHEHAD
jgi:hypothetical protein